MKYTRKHGGLTKMVRLRPYKDMDAEYILSWMEDEEAFVKWCANHFEFPLTKEQCIEYRKKYDIQENGWLFSALDEDEIVCGHILFKNVNLKEKSVHLGHIITDTAKRGKGLGKEMVNAALQYAFYVLKVDKVTLSVFDNNPSAINCYKSVGFKEYEYYPDSYPYKNTKWGCYYMELFRENYK